MPDRDELIGELRWMKTDIADNDHYQIAMYPAIIDKVLALLTAEDKRMYAVWRVLGPAGPMESFHVQGLETAKASVHGCWDYSVKDLQTDEEVLI